MKSRLITQIAYTAIFISASACQRESSASSSTEQTHAAKKLTFKNISKGMHRDEIAKILNSSIILMGNEANMMRYINVTAKGNRPETPDEIHVYYEDNLAKDIIYGYNKQ